MRVPKKFKKAIFEKEDVVFTYPPHVDKEPLTLRSVHFLLEDGNTEYLVTNLMLEQIPSEKFSELYRLSMGS